MRLPPLLSIILLLAAVARAIPPAPLPSFVKEVPVPLDALPPHDQASSGTYWLLTDLQQDIQSRKTFCRHATKILSKAGLSQASQISVDYAPEFQKVRWHRITLWRNGRAKELLPSLKPTTMRREEGYEWGLLDGRRTQLFSLEDVREGDVIEHAYTLEGENPVFDGRSSGSRYFRFGVPVERIAYRLLHPESRPLHLAALAGAPEARKIRRGGMVELSWTLERVPPLLPDYDAPSWFEPFPRIQWSEYGSWGEVVAWAEKLYRTDGPLSPELERVLARLRKHKGAPERIRHALRLVQDEVRYLGLEMGASSHRPNPPGKVFARRFGDCKDKTVLFCALMRRLGIDAVPVLVNTRALHAVANYHPSPLAFDHVIARVVHDGRRYYFDPTLSHQRGDPLASQMLHYGMGLPIDAGAEWFDVIEAGPDDGGRIVTDQEFTLPRIDSTASLSVKTVYTGAEADRVRHNFATSSREEIAKGYLNYYAQSYPAIAATGPIGYEDDSSSNIVTVTEAYAVDSLCSVGAGRAACSIYPQEIANWVSSPERRIRNSPYQLAYPKKLLQRIQVRLPEPLGIKADSRTITHHDFSFVWNEKSVGDMVHLDYEYTAYANHVPLERFPRYLASLDTIDENIGATLFPDRAGFGLPFHQPNQFLILYILVCAGAGIWAARRVNALRPPGLPPPFGSVPRGLGGLLLLLGFGLAVRPFVQGWYLFELRHLMEQSSWNALTVRGGESYHPFWAPFLLLDIFGGVVFLCLSIALIPLFLRRRSIFPKAFILVTSFGLAFQGFDAIGLHIIPEELRGSDDDPWGKEWIRDVFVSALWFIYLLRSSRVAETFVHPLPAVSPLQGEQGKVGEAPVPAA